jgi:hypothetical protein
VIGDSHILVTMKLIDGINHMDYTLTHLDLIILFRSNDQIITLTIPNFVHSQNDFICLWIDGCDLSLT